MPNFSLWLDDESSETLGQVLTEVIADADILEEPSPPFQDFRCLVHPGSGSVRYLASLLRFSSEDRSELRTANPIAEATRAQSVYIREIRTNEMTGEALVFGNYGGADGPELNFFDPGYLMHVEDYAIHAENQIVLSGLVLHSKSGFETEIEITEGPLLQLTHEQNLKDDPDAEFPDSIAIDLSYLRSLLPSSREGEEDAAQFQTRVERLESVSNPFGQAVLRFDALCLRASESVTLPGDIDLEIPFYLHPRHHEGGVIEEGTLLRGNVWLQGWPAGSASPFSTEAPE